MKLYTEEQVNTMLSRARLHNQDDTEMFTNEYLIAYETPIELPSDEEIDEKSHYKISNNTKTPNWYFIAGAKWMKEKILNQNKELLILDFDKVKEEWIKEANGMTELEKVKYYFKKINDNQNK